MRTEYGLGPFCPLPLVGSMKLGQFDLSQIIIFLNIEIIIYVAEKSTRCG